MSKERLEINKILNKIFYQDITNIIHKYNNFDKILTCDICKDNDICETMMSHKCDLSKSSCYKYCYKCSKILCLKLIIRGINLAQSRGVYNLSEAELLSKSIKFFTVPTDDSQPSLKEIINREMAFKYIIKGIFLAKKRRGYRLEEDKLLLNAIYKITRRCGFTMPLDLLFKIDN